MKLSRLKKIPLRKVWQHEAFDLTKWLAKKENLTLLGESLNLHLEAGETEQPAGDFSVDILARDENDNLVVIENQLERTDHDHLGKIITYAAAREANTIVWVVERARDEHRQAIDWLNQRTDSKANFFLLELEVWQIDDSSYAPKFNVVVAPNDWSKAMRSSSGRAASPLALERSKFWQAFTDYADSKDYEPLRNLKHIKGWTGLKVGSGREEGYFYAGTDANKKVISVELFILGDKMFFQKLFDQKNEIKKDLKMQLDWQQTWKKRPKSKYSTIILEKKAKFNDPDQRQANVEWLYETAKRFCEVFPKYF